MPEATVLYSVTAVVVAGLVIWVGAVLKTAKDPWARPAPPPLEAAVVDAALAAPAPAPAVASEPAAAPEPAASAEPSPPSEGKTKASEGS